MKCKKNVTEIDKSQLSKIFDTFTKPVVKDRINIVGTEIGLSTYDKLGSPINLESEIDSKSKFTVGIKK